MPGWFSSRLLIGLLVGMALSIQGRMAGAQVGSDRYASIVMDANTGAVLSQVNADDYRFPASLTKMMTLYLLFEAVRDRRVSLDEPVPVSSNASSMSPTKLGLLPGTYITVEQALLGLVTKSANDAACALGEMMGGDEERFAQIMTLRARALGMSNTTFRNASGLPDWSQVTTARDMATLARHLIQDFPAYYRYFSVPYFTFQGRQVLNHQRMLQTYPGADGLKTGWIEASGYNVVTSAVHGSTRLIGVVLGAASGGERDAHMAMLLDQGFEREGGPVVARREPASRMSALIAAAQAAHALPLPSPFNAAPPYQPAPYLPAPFVVQRPTARVHGSPDVVVQTPQLAHSFARAESRYAHEPYYPKPGAADRRHTEFYSAPRAEHAPALHDPVLHTPVQHGPLPLPPVHVIHPTRTATGLALVHSRG